MKQHRTLNLCYALLWCRPHPSLHDISRASARARSIVLVPCMQFAQLRNCACARTRGPDPIHLRHARHDVMSYHARHVASYHTRARRVHALFVHIAHIDIVQTTRTPTCFFTRPGAQTRPNITRRVVAIVEVWASLLFLRFFRATIKQHVWLAERTVRMLQRLQHL